MFRLPTIHRLKQPIVNWLQDRDEATLSDALDFFAPIIGIDQLQLREIFRASWLRTLIRVAVMELRMKGIVVTTRRGYFALASKAK